MKSARPGQAVGQVRMERGLQSSHLYSRVWWAGCLTWQEGAVDQFHIEANAFAAFVQKRWRQTSVQNHQMTAEQSEGTQKTMKRFGQVL